jgi:LmbE family N-acetylglucosaminyl deacetylase
MNRRTALTIFADSIAGAQTLTKRGKVVVTGGHPGDPEYGCGGTIARYADLGYDVTLLYLNRGQKGCSGRLPDECGAIRTAEAGKACAILHAKPAFASHMDGDTSIDNSAYDAFRKLIEAEQPDVLFTHWPVDGHRDHRAISTLAYDAWLKMHKNFAFYYYEVSDGEDTLMFSPTDYVDITAVEPRKRSACYAHASQSPDHFYALQSQVSRFRGIERGCTHAEAFLRHSHSPKQAVGLP